ncbi:hypothetical protein PHMEG_00017870 [Phytophthora megakarya]|uniref:Uncharacterized protein n=1 Tax=Phytophthora megakarya TaxID=4795 RepID=A0A225VVH5_9STRA|nr:hypothetical protein PHMEG_00017870 [Phytophthora megakarya]
MMVTMYPTVSSLITKRLVDVYGTDTMVLMTKLTISDTASAARKVADYFKYTQLSDWRLVILKRRLLNNYFNNGIRLDALEKIQTAMGLPVLKPLVDVDVRIASTFKLMRRSLLNFVAYSSFFQTMDTGNVFDTIPEFEWQLVAEKEGITFYLSELTLSKAQQEIIVTSNMLVFLKLAEAKPQSEVFYIHDLSIPRAATTAATLTRPACSKMKLSEPAKICIARTLPQLRTRFPVADVETALTLLLDPQSKNRVKGLIQDLGQPADILSVFAVDRLKEEHLRLGKAQASRHGSSPKPDLEPANSDLEQAAATPPLDEVFILGARASSNSAKSLVESQLRADSDAVVTLWLDNEEDWVSVAYHQNRGNLSTVKITNPWVMRKTSGETASSAGKEAAGVCWNRVGLYELVDICVWFRDVGQKEFPLVASMARLWRGKSSSTSFQKRVFSTGCVIMGERRMRTDDPCAEKQLLLKPNRAENARLRGL